MLPVEAAVGSAGRGVVMSATFEVQGSADEITVVVIGEIDASNAAQFRYVVSPALMRSPPSFRVDCRRLDFMDSAGLEVFLTIVAVRRATGTPCVLLRPTEA